MQTRALAPILCLGAAPLLATGSALSPLDLEFMKEMNGLGRLGLTPPMVAWPQRPTLDQALLRERGLATVPEGKDHAGAPVPGAASRSIASFLDELDALQAELAVYLRPGRAVPAPAAQPQGGIPAEPRNPVPARVRLPEPAPEPAAAPAAPQVAAPGPLQPHRPHPPVGPRDAFRPVPGHLRLPKPAPEPGAAPAAPRVAAPGPVQPLRPHPPAGPRGASRPVPGHLRLPKPAPEPGAAPAARRMAAPGLEHLLDPATPVPAPRPEIRLADLRSEGGLPHLEVMLDGPDAAPGAVAWTGWVSFTNTEAEWLWFGSSGQEAEAASRAWVYVPYLGSPVDLPPLAGYPVEPGETLLIQAACLGRSADYVLQFTSGQPRATIRLRLPD